MKVFNNLMLVVVPVSVLVLASRFKSRKLMFLLETKEQRKREFYLDVKQNHPLIRIIRIWTNVIIGLRKLVIEFRGEQMKDFCKAGNNSKNKNIIDSSLASLTVGEL